MQLTLRHIVPIPLKDKLKDNASDVWLRELDLQQGEKIFIKAPSGTGKTTLAHMLYGLRKDYEGSIKWGSADMKTIDREGIATLRSNELSIVFQDMRLFPSLTVLENLQLKTALNKTIDEATIKDRLQQLGIRDKLNAPAATLSYGEQQRVAIIRALLQPFKWLLMDEPFSHLDQQNIDRAASLIKEVVAQNNAGLLLADLEDNDYFDYTRKLVL